jgi:outer membrane biosynthesis protein TonB
MAMLRLLLAGFLIASGLILGAFTLHGYLDPSWPQNRMQAANAQPVVANPAVSDPAKNRNQFVVRQAEPPGPPPSPIVKASAKPAPPPEARAEAKAPSKPAVKKKATEKAEKPPAPPQAASAGFPWNLFGN